MWMHVLWIEGINEEAQSELANVMICFDAVYCLLLRVHLAHCSDGQTMQHLSFLP